jgi:Uma2 family endonuclease
MAITKLVTAEELEEMPDDGQQYELMRGELICMAPDASFARADRLREVDEDHFIPLAPDLAVEVISPSDRTGYTRAKVSEYLHAGVRLLWLVDPRRRMVTVHTPDGAARVLRIEDELDGGDVLPGFRLPLTDVFR